MPKAPKIKGFSEKEQKIYQSLFYGYPRTLRQLSQYFRWEAKEKVDLMFEKGWGEAEIDYIARMIARNALRLPLKENWVEQCRRGKRTKPGLYRLSRVGLRRKLEGITVAEKYNRTDTTPRVPIRKKRPLLWKQKEAVERRKHLRKLRKKLKKIQHDRVTRKYWRMKRFPKIKRERKPPGRRTIPYPVTIPTGRRRRIIEAVQKRIKQMKKRELEND